MSYIVLCEWDGGKPPSSYYERLHKLGLFVRFDKEDAEKNYIPPLKRRAIEDGSVIAQESTVVCASQSLANYIAELAKENHAKVVFVGEMKVNDYQMTTQDAQIFNRVESIFGRKGRPSGEKLKWAITCLEETRTYQQEEESYNWVNCPFCSGMLVRGRIGEPDKYKFPSGSLFDGWKRHRFIRGEFEVPVEDGDIEPPQDVQIQHVDERATVDMMGNSPAFLEQVGKLPDHMAKKVLDGVLASRTHMGKDKRKTRRVEAVVYLFERGVSPMKVNLVESDKAVDILDASCVIGSDLAAQLWLAINK